MNQCLLKMRGNGAKILTVPATSSLQVTALQHGIPLRHPMMGSMGRFGALGAGLAAFVLGNGVVAFSPSYIPVHSGPGRWRVCTHGWRVPRMTWVWLLMMVYYIPASYGNSRILSVGVLSAHSRTSGSIVVVSVDSAGLSGRPAS